MLTLGGQLSLQTEGITMYIRLLTVPLQPGQEDELTLLTRERIAAVARAARGYRGGYAFVDRSGHSGGSVTLWETQADAEAFTQTLQSQGLLAALGPALAGTPRVETYEVTLEVPASVP